MTRIRIALGAVLAAAFVAGCGGGGGATSGVGTTPDSASIVPAGAPAFIAFDTDVDSEGWNKTEALLDKFPGKDDLLSSLRSDLAEDGLTWERDVKPALGDEVDIVWLDFEDGGDNVVGVTKPKDVAQFNALLDSDETDPTVHEQIEGWTVFADTQAQLDRFEQLRSQGGSLGDDSVFDDAMSGMPDDAIAKAYVRGSALQTQLDKSFEQAGLPSGTTKSQIGDLDSVAAAVTPQSDGITIEAAANGDVDLGGDAYHADLPNDLPANALFYLSFNNVGHRLADLINKYSQSNSSFDQQRAQLEQALGFTVGDIVDVLQGEGALVLYPTGTSTPDVLFVVHETDEEKARKLVDRLSGLAALSGSGQTRQEQIGDLTATVFTFSGTDVYTVVFNGNLVMTNSRQPIVNMAGNGPNLADDQVYENAVSSAGMPDDTDGFLYMNMKTGLEWAFSYSESQGTPVPQVYKDNTAPLRGLLTYSAKDGDTFRFTGFLGIE